MHIEKGKFPVEWKLTHSPTLCVFSCYLDHCAELKYSNISTGMFVVNFSLWHAYCIILCPYFTADYLTLIYSRQINTIEFDSIHLSTTILMWNGKLSPAPLILVLQTLICVANYVHMSGRTNFRQDFQTLWSHLTQSLPSLGSIMDLTGRTEGWTCYVLNAFWSSRK